MAVRKMSDTPLPPHEFWQQLYAPGTLAETPEDGFRDLYPASLPDGRRIALPIRVLPGDGSRAVASLIVNQASFSVEDALAEALAEKARTFEPEVIVGVPTLGITMAAAVARRLGHSRIVPLGTSRKFWYEEGLSEPVASITSPGHEKRVYLDPRMLPLLEGRRVAVVDDVISTGTSMGAVLRLLSRAGVRPVAVFAAMLQGGKGPSLIAAEAGWRGPIVTAIRTPLLERSSSGGWVTAE
jgi:adenine/guanine phosphoribosyltransferase-like PRPP-binding protein